MAITDETESTATMTAVLTVRVPDRSEADLVTDAQRRLSRVEGVHTVTMENVRGLEPGVSATHVTVAVSIESDASADDLREHLAATVSIETVSQLIQE